ncbi:MAG: hypothetical protein KDA69_15340 [Planctomycetaceae bacterium]|nr:hypothetical protein [Planctomycetaceae bacterium]MCA9045700.1 hypothetical protein [Planctomycetaceae bacterium]
MERNRIIIRYYNRRMLLTVDVNALLQTVFDACGDRVGIEFAEMDETEQEGVVELIDGMRAIRNRFYILEMTPGEDILRREDLEKLSVAVGRK